jgi:hypothetical protein
VSFDNLTNSSSLKTSSNGKLRAPTPKPKESYSSSSFKSEVFIMTPNHRVKV